MTRPRLRLWLVVLVVLVIPAIGDGQEQGGAADLAKQLQNPVADLISVPLQSNLDFGVGRPDGFRYTLNVQPVIPLSISREWNLISRTIFPVIYQNDTLPGGGRDQFGSGDTVQSFFLSPKAPFRVLANHIWSFAGDDDRADVSQTFLQPFLSYTFSNAVTLTAQTESTYDWTIEQWTVPIALGVSKVVTIGSLPVSLALFARYWADGPSSAPEWGLRFVVTFLVPKGKKP